MSCPTCGTSANCPPNCRKGSWGSFESWGGSSGSGDWAKAPAVASGGAAWSGIPGLSSSDGWASATATIEPPPSTQGSPDDGWSQAPPTPSSRSWEERSDDEDGWASAPPPDPSPPSDQEDASGWLGAYQEPAPPTALSDPWVEDEDEAWLDEVEDDNDRDHGRKGSTAPASSASRTLLWAASLALTVLVGAGAMALHKPAAAPPDAAAVAQSQAAESLADGRRLVRAGTTSMAGAGGGKADPEAAAFQFRAAIPKLKDGGAAVAEIREARALLARSLVSAGLREEGHAAWSELKTTPEFKVESAKSLASLEAKLVADAERHRDNAEGLLKAKEYRRAEAAAREAVRLHRAFGGKASARGMAFGALGYANLGLGRKGEAVSQLRRAAELYPQGNYDVALASLRSVAPQAQTEVAPPVAAPRVVNAEINDGSDYPNGTAPRAGGSSGSGRSTPDEPGAPVAEVETPRRMVEIPAAKPTAPAPGRHRKDDGLDMEDRSKRS